MSRYKLTTHSYLSAADGVINTPQYFNDNLHVSKPGVKPPRDVFKVSQKRGGAVPDKYVDMGPDSILEDVYGPYKEGLAKDWIKGFNELMKVDNLSTRGYMQQKT